MLPFDIGKLLPGDFQETRLDRRVGPILALKYKGALQALKISVMNIGQVLRGG
jgi:hypothetical protein